jgi:hypothetical protein
MVQRLAQAIAVGLLLATPPSHAIQRCESDGKVEYRDAPCPQGKATEVQVDPMNPTSTDAERARMRAHRDKDQVEALERQAKAERAARERAMNRGARADAEAKRRASRCKQMARSLALTTQTAAKHGDDPAWRNKVRKRQEEFDLTCR